MFASMIPQPAIAFKIDIDYNLSSEELAAIADNLNNTIELSEPERVTGLKNDKPEDEMITFLLVIDDILKNTKYPKYRAIINGLKEADAWTYDPDKKAGYGRTSPEEKEERYLKRHYIAKALENGWIERPSPNTMRLTESGKAYISVYGKKDVPDSAQMKECLSSCNEFVSSNNRCLTSVPNDGLILHRMERMMMRKPRESNTVTFGRKKKHTFRIVMD